MNMKYVKITIISIITLMLNIFLGSNFVPQADACTRVVYKGVSGSEIVITARSMDWQEDPLSNLWVFPRKMQRSGVAGPNSLTWTSKYGSVIASGGMEDLGDLVVTDGMNEQGLVANLLYLAESDYGTVDEARPHISISIWAQYVLDNYATVAEAVAALQSEPFQIIAPLMPNGRRSALHLSISDTTGDSAILQYIDGKLVINHNAAYQVMTNSPIFSQQLAINKYWQDVGASFVPGTARAADRFARASMFIAATPLTADNNRALAIALSIIRSVSVPLDLPPFPGKPNISNTFWRTVADHKNKVYYFDSALSPNVFWVPLGKFDLSPGAPIKKLTLTSGSIYAGNVADHFVATEPFKPLPGR
jgi:choloylglycine hydrolase